MHVDDSAVGLVCGVQLRWTGTTADCCDRAYLSVFQGNQNNGVLWGKQQKQHEQKCEPQLVAVQTPRSPPTLLPRISDQQLHLQAMYTRNMARVCGWCQACQANQPIHTSPWEKETDRIGGERHGSYYLYKDHGGCCRVCDSNSNGARLYTKSKAVAWYTS